MRTETMYYLLVQYPTLSGFFKACFEEGEYDKAIDFLFALETDNIH